MSIDFILFPAPKDTYSIQDELLGTLIFIPKLTDVYPHNTDRINTVLHKVVQFVQIEQKSSDESFVYDFDESSKDLDQPTPQSQKQTEQLQDHQKQQIEFEDLMSDRSRSRSLSKRLILRDVSLPPKWSSPTLSDKNYSVQTPDNIPCLYIKANIIQPNLIIYFHGNASNIKQASKQVYKIVHQLQISALLVEYPGYGMYPEAKNTGQTIKDDAQYIYQYLIRKLGYKEKNLLVFGRSIGSGPATYIASLNNPCCLILMCPFTTIKDLVSHLSFKLLAHFIDERFDNLQMIEKVTSPIFILHGKRDVMIPPIHSEQLIKCSNKSIKTQLHLAENMDHEHFNFMNDLIRPLAIFLFDIGFEFEGGSEPELLNQFQ